MHIHADIDYPIVGIASGKLRGGVTPAGRYFKGIPYGGSTAGAKRFRRPSPAPTWSGMPEAREFGPRCPQNNGVTKPANAWIRDVRTTGEDCLCLNVWTPSLDGAAKRPVMVWLHGGGYSRGFGGAPGLDGSNLAHVGDVVVVTLNHRLNTFGYTYVGDEDERFADSGNAGVLDIVQALEWIRDHIARFGGDAGNVETRPTMTFDHDARVAYNPRPEALARIKACPRVVSDAQWVEPEASACLLHTTRRVS